jgi:hypothetical protein
MKIKPILAELPSMEDMIDQLSELGTLEVTLLASEVPAFRRDFNKAREQYRKTLGEDADKRRSSSIVGKPFKQDGLAYACVTYTLAGQKYRARMQNKYGVLQTSILSQEVGE